MEQVTFETLMHRLEVVKDAYPGIELRYLEDDEKFLILLNDIDNNTLFSEVFKDEILLLARQQVENIDDDKEIMAWKNEYLRNSILLISRREGFKLMPI